MASDWLDLDTRVAYFDCARCHGTGAVYADFCFQCGGSGQIGVYLGAFFDGLAMAAGLAACDQRRALFDRVERLERAVAGVVSDWQSSGDGDYVLYRLRAALEVDRG